MLWYFKKVPICPTLNSDLYDKSDVRFYKPVGCGACNNTGYSGRVGVFEILPVSQTLKELINRRVFS